MEWQTQPGTCVVCNSAIWRSVAPNTKQVTRWVHVHDDATRDQPHIALPVKILRSTRD